MIKASFTDNRELFEISVKVMGHAGQAEMGKDIVCASASILFSTLAQIITSLEGRLEDEPVIKYESGDALISCRCKNMQTFVKVLNAYHFTKVGYTLLAQNYPQYVELITDGEA